MSLPASTTSFSHDDHSSIPTDLSGYSPPALAFVNQTGPPSRSPDTQRLVRSHVMYQVGKLRRRGRPVKAPLLKFDLEVPDEPTWDEASWKPLQYHLQPPTMVECFNGALEQDRDSRSGPSNVKTSHVRNLQSFGSQPSITRHSQNLHQVSENEPSERDLCQDEKMIPCIERLSVGRSDPFARYPIDMNFRAQELIDHIFDDRIPSFKPFRNAWLLVVTMDPAAFHQFLANVALCVSLLRGIDKAVESYEAIFHHTYAINLVNKKMSDPSFAISDEIIGAVTAFICYYNKTGNVKSWQTHMDGLKKIIRLRGGLDSPSLNPFVRIVLSAADIGGSCNQDIPPAFPLPYFVPERPIYPTYIDLPFLSVHTSLALRILLPPTNHHIIAIMDDLFRLTAFLKAESVRTHSSIYQDASLPSTHIDPILHRLLRLSPSSSSTREPASTPKADSDNIGATTADDGLGALQEAIRLAAILYLAPIRRAFGVLPVASAIQLSKLRSLLARDWPPRGDSGLRQAWTPLPALQLWVLAVGVVEARDAEGDGQGGDVQAAWFCERLWAAAEEGAQRLLLLKRGDDGASSGGQRRRMEDLEDVVLKRFLWIDELHGARFWRNWRVGSRHGLQSGGSVNM